MATHDDEHKQDVVVRATHKPLSVPFGPAANIDLSHVSEREREQMLAAYNKGLLDVSRKAHEMKVDSDALRSTLNSLGNATNEAAQAGNAVTITHTQQTSIGRTEVIMGNTDQAKTGRLTRSQTGEKDLTPFYIGGGLVALIVIAAILGSG